MTDRIVKVVLRGDISDLTGKLKAVQASVADTGSRMTGATREAARFRTGLSAVGDTAGKAGLVAAAGLGAIVVTTARFDKAMSSVQAATHQSASAMQDLREAAIKAGADTAFSASEAAGGIEELAKAGVSTKDILGGGLKGSLDLAAAGALGVGSAAEIAATAMTQFQLGGDKVSHIADLLAAGAGNAQGSVEDLGMALKQSGLVASQTGLTIEETTGTLAAFASAGLIGSDAGTSFKTMLQALTPSGEKAASEMERLGISAYDAQGNFVGMTKFADSLKNGLKNLSVEQQNAALKTIFGADAVRAASVVFQQGGAGIQSWIDKTNQSGYAAETAATRLDNLSGDLEAFKGSLESALIGAGEGSQGGLRDLVQGATNAVNAFNSLPGPVKSSTTALLGVTAILGGGLWFTAKTLAGITAMRTNLALLGPAGARAAAGMRAAGVAAAAFVAVDIGAALGDSLDSRSTKEIDQLGKSLQDLAKTGKATGDLGDLFGEDLGGKAVKFGKDLGSIGESLQSLKGYADDSSLTELGKFFGSGGQSLGIVAQAEAVQDLDAALSRLNENDPAAAAQAFGILSEKAKATGASAADIKAAFPSMTALIDGAGSASSQTADEIIAMGGAAEGATVDVNTFKDAIDALLDPLLNQEDASNAWKDSLASLTAELKENGGNLDDNTVQGRKNQDAIRERVKALKASAQADFDAGGTSEEMAAKLQRGARSIIKTAEAADLSKREVRKYLNELGLTPDQIRTALEASDYATPKVRKVVKGVRELDSLVANPKINVTDNATGKVRAIQQYIDGMHGKTVKVSVQGGTPGGITSSAMGGAIPRAAGGSVVGPGTATSDSIEASGPGNLRYRLSNGEHILTANEVDIIGGQESVYAMRAAIRNRQFAFATGGGVGGTGGGSTSVDLVATGIAPAIGAAVRNALYGTTFQILPDGSIRAKQMGA